MMKLLFLIWLGRYTNLSYKSCLNYANAIDIISGDMKKQKIISEDLYKVKKMTDFTIMESNIYKNRYFINKNHKGHNMYSRALHYYKKFLFEIL